LDGPSVAVDFAKNAESWGAVGLRARTVDEFRRAVRRALKEKRSVVIDAKVSPKSMTQGYESWWRVGTAEVSSNPDVVQAAEAMKREVARTRKF